MIKERHVVYISRLVAGLASSKHSEVKEKLLTPEGLRFLRHCAKSKNKQIRLNTVKTLGDLCSDGAKFFIRSNVDVFRQIRKSSS